MVADGQLEGRLDGQWDGRLDGQLDAHWDALRRTWILTWMALRRITLPCFDYLYPTSGTTAHLDTAY